MYKLKITTLFFLIISLLSCTIYKSPDRKAFESDAVSFKVQDLQAVKCSTVSVQKVAHAAKLASIFNTHATGESVFIWEYNVDGQTVFESNNLKGIYCLYENI